MERMLFLWYWQEYRQTNESEEENGRRKVYGRRKGQSRQEKPRRFGIQVAFWGWEAMGRKINRAGLKGVGSRNMQAGGRESLG